MLHHAPTAEAQKGVFAEILPVDEVYLPVDPTGCSSDAKRPASRPLPLTPTTVRSGSAPRRAGDLR
jgi:hypothetical protein